MLAPNSTRVAQPAAAGVADCGLSPSTKTNCRACTHVLWSAQGHTGDAINVLQSELSNGLASLLLVARVDSDRGARGHVDLALLALGLVARLILLDLDVLLLGLVGELFNAGVGHVGRVWLTRCVGGAVI